MDVTYTKKQKAFAAALCAVIALVMLFSSLYILMEADHDCTGRDCAVCVRIQQCEDTLQLLSCGMTACKNTITVILCLTAAALFLYAVSIIKSTPIAQRVRMNN